MMNRAPDLLIVGAGPVGCVVAERAAVSKGWTSLLIDRRTHVAGNCHDAALSSGVIVHKYGPHYFRTNSPKLVSYLSRFTEWIPGRYFVRSRIEDDLYPFPINLTTLEKFFKKRFTPLSGRKLLGRLRTADPDPSNSEDYVLSKAGRQLYEAFYLGYTLKQWGLHPRDLPSGVCGRIPIRFNRDASYVDARFKIMPKRGFTTLFAKMVGHPRIQLRLGVDYRDIRRTVSPGIATVYCGPIDEFFDYKLGRLQWRSLDFEFMHFDREYIQPCVQINYPGLDIPYTRSVEFKHVSGQRHSQTVVSYEFPRTAGEPFYPVPTAENAKLYRQYRELAKAEESRPVPVYFCGRLAEYKYMNMDEAMESALGIFDELAHQPSAKVGRGFALSWR